MDVSASVSGAKSSPAVSSCRCLPGLVGRREGDNPDWKAQNTDIWPVQEFNWRDFTANQAANTNIKWCL